MTVSAHCANLRYSLGRTSKHAIRRFAVESFDSRASGDFRRFGDHETHFSARLVGAMLDPPRERDLPSYRAVSSATDSMWNDCGNRSTRRTERSAYPPARSVTMSRASVIGSHET